MTKISLASYLLKLINKNTKQVQELDRILIGGNNIHLNNIFENYFNSKIGEYTNDKNSQKAFLIQNYDHYEEMDGNLIKYHKHVGILETGSYGYSSKIYDEGTHTVLFEKSPQNPEMLPFYYGIYVPENGVECVCIFERFSNYGFKSVIQSDLINYFKENYSDYSLIINPLLPSDYINNFINNGRILKLRLLRNSLPEDITDAIGNNNQNGKAELVIKAEPKGDLGIRTKILRIFNRESTVTQAFELLGFEYDNAKIEVKVGKTNKTLDLSELENVTGYLDITEEVETIDGHPIFESIHQLSKEYAEHFLKERDII